MNIGRRINLMTFPPCRRHRLQTNLQSLLPKNWESFTLINSSCQKSMNYWLGRLVKVKTQTDASTKSWVATKTAMTSSRPALPSLAPRNLCPWPSSPRNRFARATEDNMTIKLPLPGVSFVSTVGRCLLGALRLVATPQEHTLDSRGTTIRSLKRVRLMGFGAKLSNGPKHSAKI